MDHSEDDSTEPFLRHHPIYTCEQDQCDPAPGPVQAKEDSSDNDSGDEFSTPPEFIESSEPEDKKHAINVDDINHAITRSQQSEPETSPTKGTSVIVTDDSFTRQRSTSQPGDTPASQTTELSNDFNEASEVSPSPNHGQETSNQQVTEPSNHGRNDATWRSEPPTQPLNFEPPTQARESESSAKSPDSEPPMQLRDFKPSTKPPDSEPPMHLQDSGPPVQPRDSKPSSKRPVSEPPLQPRDSEPSVQLPHSGGPVRHQDPELLVQSQDFQPLIQPQDSEAQIQPLDCKPSIPPQDSKPPTKLPNSETPIQSQDFQPSIQPQDSEAQIQPLDSNPSIPPQDSKPPTKLPNSETPIQSQDFRPPIQLQDSEAQIQPLDSKPSIPPQDSKPPTKLPNSETPIQSQDFQPPIQPQDSEAQIQPLDSKPSIPPQDSKPPTKLPNSETPIQSQDSESPIQPLDSEPSIPPQDTKPPSKLPNSETLIQSQDSKSPIQPQDSEAPIQLPDSEPPIPPQDSKPPTKLQDSETPVQSQDSKPQIQLQDSEPPIRPHYSEPSIPPSKERHDEGGDGNRDLPPQPQDSKPSALSTKEPPGDAGDDNGDRPPEVQDSEVEDRQEDSQSVVSTLLCEQCDEAEVAFSCRECELLLCSKCDAFLHRKGAARRHKREPFQAKEVEPVDENKKPSPASNVQCQRCEKASAVVSCSSCLVVLCQECNTALHSRGPGTEHIRKPFEDAFDRPAPSTIICDQCEEPGAILQCKICQVLLCRGCDATLHGQDALREHVREELQPTKPIYFKDLQSEVPLYSRAQMATAMAASPRRASPTCEKCGRTLTAVDEANRSDSSLCDSCKLVQKYTDPQDDHPREEPEIHRKETVPLLEEKIDKSQTQQTELPDPADVANMPSGEPSVGISKEVEETCPDDQPPGPLPPTPQTGIICPRCNATFEGASCTCQLSPASTPGIQTITPVSDAPPDNTKPFKVVQLLRLVLVKLEGVTVKKVFIVPGSMHKLANLHGSEIGGDDSFTFDKLKDACVHTRGLYGDTGQVCKWLISEKLLDASTTHRLLDEEPGLYCITNGGDVQFLFLRPTKDAFTRVSRKNATCNLFRYLVQLCDEVLVFFAEGDVESLRRAPPSTKKKPKRIKKANLSLRSDTKEDISFSPGFSRNLPNELLPVAGQHAEIANSSQNKALHISQLLPRRTFESKMAKSFLTQEEVRTFFEERLQKFRIVIGKSVRQEAVLGLMKMSSPDGETAFARLVEEEKRIDGEQSASLRTVELAHSEEKMKRGEMLETAVNGHIYRNCILSKLFFQDLWPLSREDAKVLETSVKCSLCTKLLSDPRVQTCGDATLICCHDCFLSRCTATGGKKRKKFLCMICQEHHQTTRNYPQASKEMVNYQKLEMVKRSLDRGCGGLEPTPAQETAIKKADQLLKRHTRSSTFDKVLRNHLVKLEQMQRAFVLFCLQSHKAGKPTSSDLVELKTFMMKASSSKTEDFCEKYVEENSTSWRLWSYFSGKKKTHDLLREEMEMKARLVEEVSATGVPEIFEDRELVEAAKKIRSQMNSTLKTEVNKLAVFSTLESQRSQFAGTADSKKAKLRQSSENDFKQRLKRSCQLSNPLRMEIYEIDLPNKAATGFSSWNFRAVGKAVLSVKFVEEEVAPISSVHRLFPWDATLHDQATGEGEQASPLQAEPVVQPEEGNFPLMSASDTLLKLFYLKSKKMMGFVRASDKDGGSVKVYVLPVDDYRSRNGLEKPIFTSGKNVELVDFDESSRLVAFYLPGEHTVCIYRCLPEMTAMSPCRPMDLAQRIGPQKLTHICFVPQKEKLILIDKGNHCHMLEIRNKNVTVKTHDPLKVDVPIDKLMISHEGTFLLVFSSRSSEEVDVDPKAENEDDDQASTVGQVDTSKEEPTPCMSSNDDSASAKPLQESAFSSSTGKQHDVLAQARGDVEKDNRQKKSSLCGSEQKTNAMDHNPRRRSSDAQPKSQIAQTSKLHQGAAEQSQSSSPVVRAASVAVHVFSFTTFKKLKEINVGDFNLSIDMLASAQIALLGKQAHLVFFNRQQTRLLSCAMEVQSNENVLVLKELEEGDKSAAKEQQDKEADGKPSSCLDYVYHIFDKFCTEDSLQTSRQDIRLRCVLPDEAVEKKMCDEKDCVRQVQAIQDRLRWETHKPMNNFDIHVRSLPLTKCSWRHLPEESSVALAPELSDWLKRVACLVPIQIARAEENKLTPFSNGMKSEEVVGSVVSVADMAENIDFGIYEQILEEWPGPVKVVSSMGKQSTGKSYMLNHLTGSMFDISGTRCTDGVWMTLRITPDCLYVVLDFEGLGSLERSPQEDMLLSVLNAAISGLTLFKTEFRVDQDTRDMFRRFRDGVECIKGDPRLLRGWFYIIIKDVEPRDIADLHDEFTEKLETICKADQGNFLTKMYQGNCAVAAFPALGSPDFYNELDSLWDHLASESTPVFQSGKEFKEVMKVVLAKISIGDWSSFDSTVMSMKLERLRQDLFANIIPTGLTINRKEEKLPLAFSDGKPVPDDVLALSFSAEGEVYSLPDTGLVLRQASNHGQLVSERQRYFMERYGQRDDHSDVSLWTKHLQEYLVAVCERRAKRVLAWLEDRTSGFPEEGSVDLLHSEVTMALGEVRQYWMVCQEPCSRCFYLCLLGKYHDGEHDCQGDHKCKHTCDFCKELEEQDPLGDLQQAEDKGLTVCAYKAGHEGRHNCHQTNHTCGGNCELMTKAENCNVKCVLEVNHNGPHRCAVKLHLCGKPCDLKGCCPKKCTKHWKDEDQIKEHVCVPSCKLSCCCPNKCTKHCEDDHTEHECRDHACRQTCPIANCGRKCSNTDDHFHGFDKVLGIFREDVKHFCGMTHPCPEPCGEKGTCSINSEMKYKEDCYETGAGSKIKYKSYTAQEPIRKQCSITIPPYQTTHAGGHSCRSTQEHSCEERCPMCKYICHRKIGHPGEHETVHGNMRETLVIAESDEFSVGENKYARGDSGKAEMCNMHCKSLGRGHIHLEPCSDKAKDMSKCTAHHPDNGRRHQKETTVYRSKEKTILMDELQHEAYWRHIGWVDPCGREDQESFKLCGFMCSAEEHEARGKSEKIFCTEDLWHAPLKQTDLGSKFDNDGYVDRTGHHFPCANHTVAVHHLLIVDTSWSMDDSDQQPVMAKLRSSHPHRLGAVINACFQYLDHRNSEVASNDMVSFIEFNSSASILFEAKALDPDKLLERMTTLEVGGGTAFTPVNVEEEKTKSFLPAIFAVNLEPCIRRNFFEPF